MHGRAVLGTSSPMERPESQRDEPRSYRLIGFLTGSFGLAVAARNTMRALAASGRRVEGVTVQNRYARGAEGIRPRAPASRRDVNLFHMNPLEIAGYEASWRPAVERAAPNVCVPFWELPRVPADWVPVLNAMQAVLAPTRFIESACTQAVPAGRVLHYPQAVFVPDTAPARQAWGFPEGTTVFLVSFDIGSDIDRKNPWAAIEAFRHAFPSDPGVQLVIKVKPWPNVPAFHGQSRELAERIAADGRIRIVDASLSYEDLMSLYASCDVMVALHRSEGLGLHLMEAMSLGKPVVATGWSGNADFMTSGNSVPVRYRLVPVRSRHDAYRPQMGREGQVWAEADIAHAVEALRSLREDDRRRTLGMAASADMAERRRQLLSGVTFDALEAKLAGAVADPGKLRRAVRRTRAVLYWRALRNAPLAVLRRIAPTGRRS